jgi:hypothetical protein
VLQRAPRTTPAALLRGVKHKEEWNHR